MRSHRAPRVLRLEELLEAEIERGRCGRKIANGLFSGFVKFKFDFVVDNSGQLRWWLITDADYSELFHKGMIRPNE